MKRACDIWADAYVDAAGGNPPPAFAVHLEGCAHCRRTVEELRSDLELLRPDPAPVPGPWLAASIRRAAEAGRKRRPSRLVVMAPLAAASVALIALAFVSSLTRQAVEPSSYTAWHQPAGGEMVPAALALDDLDEDGIIVVGDEWGGRWGAGISTLLAQADEEELSLILENLPPEED